MKFGCSPLPVRENVKFCACVPLVAGKPSVPVTVPAAVGENVKTICVVCPPAICVLPPLTRWNAEPVMVTSPIFQPLLILLPMIRVTVLVEPTAVGAAVICPFGSTAARPELAEGRYVKLKL